MDYLIAGFAGPGTGWLVLLAGTICLVCGFAAAFAVGARVGAARVDRRVSDEVSNQREAFRLLFDSNPIPMFVYETQTLRFLAVNDAAIARYGYSRERFLAMSVFDIKPHGQWDELRQAMEIGTGAHPSGGIWRHVRADGVEIDVTIHARSLVYEGNSARLAAATDITERRRVESDLARTRAFLDKVIDHVPIPITVKDAHDLKYTLVNRAAEEFWGVPRDRMIGRTASELFSKEAADTIADYDRQLIEAGRPLLFDEHTFVMADKRSRTVMSNRMPILDDSGAPQYLVTAVDDITERKKAEAELRRTRTFLDTVIENLPIMITVKDASDQSYVLVNRASEKIFKLPAVQMIGKRAHDIVAPDQAAFFEARDRDVLNGRKLVSFEHNIESDTGAVRRVSAIKAPILGDNGEPQYLVTLSEDVTERLEAQQRIAYMAHHDALTGLANRTLFFEKISEAGARLRRSGETFTVLMLDLDRFKDINDSLGHAAGDELLKETALRLKSSLRETDVVARLGGDEFAVIQSGAENQREGAIGLAIKILQIAGEPFHLDGRKVSVGASIGIALAPGDGIEPSDLLKMADLALYQTKSKGRNDFTFFNAEMTIEAETKHRLENELREAILRNELELHYQPVVDAKTLRMCALEALVRWRHPLKGLIYPDRFIGLAEDTGLIVPLGEWVLQKACADAARWPAHIKVAVNLSPVQFRKRDLLEIILGMLAENELPPERLELEITESVLMENDEDYPVMLQQLRKLGITISLDDFGTGYSSLTYLTNFPFDKIKIDKSFTQGLFKSASSTAVVSSVVTLAHGLDIVTTAEGVETQDQLDLLRAAGVHQVQGYLFGRPGPMSELDFSLLQTADGEVEKVA